MGEAEAAGAATPGSSPFSCGVWVMEFDLGSYPSPLASWLCGLGQMTQSLGASVYLQNRETNNYLTG